MCGDKPQLTKLHITHSQWDFPGYLMAGRLAHRSFAFSVSCTTPDGRQGQCIDLRQCAELYDILQYKRPLTTADRNYLSRSQCGYYNNSPLVNVYFRSAWPPDFTGICCPHFSTPHVFRCAVHCPRDRLRRRTCCRPVANAVWAHRTGSMAERRRSLTSFPGIV